ncbi:MULTISPECIES: DUF2243 domain-containing protein [Kocuria]|jgi:uncharacterized membrane protein|uniref:DUF2243 domain-containing protein n=1 Tax=Kocuria TaxID=57493 RepID=UPI0020423EEA|nr:MULTISPECIES: DUF2243 domain-containing protein [Kocuria]MCM3687123.1 DUF2243 domain-containing protein [Kocuria rosea]
MPTADASAGRGAPAGGTPGPDRRTLLAGALLGAGIAASVVDLAVFHLILHWHHFYDLSTPDAALVSDGLFHAFGWFVTVGSLFLLADVRRRGAVSWGRWSGGLLAGLGLFQLLDGVLLHKVLRLHQIRYDVDLLVYDATWIGTAGLALVAGLVVLRRTGRARAAR